MQDRIDELQAELRDFHSLGRVQQPIGQPLSEELESKSPGMESDPGKTPLPPRRGPYRPSISYCDLMALSEETLYYRDCFCRYWIRGRSAVQLKPRSRDDVGAAEGATPSGNGGFAEPAAKQGGSRRQSTISVFSAIGSELVCDCLIQPVTNVNLFDTLHQN